MKRKQYTDGVFRSQKRKDEKSKERRLKCRRTKKTKNETWENYTVGIVHQRHRWKAALRSLRHAEKAAAEGNQCSKHEPGAELTNTGHDFTSRETVFMGVFLSFAVKDDR